MRERARARIAHRIAQSPASHCRIVRRGRGPRERVCAARERGDGWTTRPSWPKSGEALKSGTHTHAHTKVHVRARKRTTVSAYACAMNYAKCVAHRERVNNARVNNTDIMKCPQDNDRRDLHTRLLCPGVVCRSMDHREVGWLAHTANNSSNKYCSNLKSTRPTAQKNNGSNQPENLGVSNVFGGVCVCVCRSKTQPSVH